MQFLANLSVRRPVLATVMILILVVVGLVGYRTLGVDKFPKVDFPTVTIVTEYPGASPSAVETDVTQKIEEAINATSGLSELSSTSTEGMSLVVASFELEIDGDQAVEDINQKIQTVLRDLPTGTRPEVKKTDGDAAPIVVLSVKGPDGLPVRELTRFAIKHVKERVERINGVGQVTLLGGQERQIDVRVDPVRLAAAEVSAIDVQRAIQNSNVNVPGGRIEAGPNNTTLRIDARAIEAGQIGEIVVRQHGDLPILVKDVADIVDGEEPAETAAARNGVPAIALSVRKQSGTNTVAVVDAVKAAVADQQSSLPPGYTVDVVRDNSEQIRTSTHQVLEHLIIGSILAALIVLLFLGSLRSTIIAAVSIPVSIIATFGLMMVAGFTLNMLTLLALALAVGIVIDDAIVVLENIHRFIHEKQMKPFRAAVEATKEIGLAVLATTLSLMAVFLPVAFMSGIVGRFLFSFGMTMAFAILVSMIVAFTLTPLMSSRMLAPAPTSGHAKQGWLERASNYVYRPIEKWYGKLLAFCLRRRWVVGLAIIGSCASLVPLSARVGGDFLPQNDEAQFEIYVQTPEGTSLEATTLITERLARRTREVVEVESTLVTIADGDQRLSNIGRVYARLVDPADRSRDQNHVMDQVRKDILQDVPAGTRVAVQQVSDFSTGGGQNAMVSYVISGPDLDKLEQYGKQVMASLKDVPGVVDLDSSLVDPVDESTVTPNFQRAATLGVDPADITQTLAVLIGGVEASTFEDRGDQYTVLVRAAEAFRTDPRALSQIDVPSKTLGRVPLTDVITLGKGKAVSKITRQSRARAVIITMNVAPGHPQSEVTQALDQAVAELHMAPGYRPDAYGNSKEMRKMQAAFAFAIVLAVIFMYLVLAAQFESWLHPFTILLSLPLTVPFAMLSLVITGGTLNIFSMLGVIVLFAMVKKNSILQVDHTNALRRAGMPRDEAVLAANKDRLKPILMTTLAFVAGMLPLVTSNGIGSGFSKAMASVITGGQTMSLLLTLVAIPVIYTWFDDASVFAGKVIARMRGNRPAIDRGAAELGIHSL
jgi:hydrophobic/amphiphilic exporter-1 (mainly G- bacteria), HAE1 family